MEKLEDIRIVTVEKLRGDVLITFKGGRSAIYSARLLHTLLSQAKAVQEAEFED